jgi:CRISPR-associated protein Csm4
VPVRLYDLDLRGAVHFGERGIGLEAAAPTLASDGWASAIIAAAARAYGDPAALIADFESGALHVSGLFPRKGRQRFVPRPLIAPRMADSAPSKELKRLRFVDLDRYRKWYLDDNGSATAEEVDALQGSLKETYREQLVARVTLDRTTSASQIYYISCFRFYEGAGLHAIVDYCDESVAGRFEQALDALTVYGLGGKRSGGYGGFKWRPVEDEATRVFAGMIAAQREPAMLLSTVLPAKEDDLTTIALQGRYAIAEIRGWVTTPGSISWRRSPLRALTHGSVLPFVPVGSVADCAAPGFAAHRVLRVATGFGLRISRRFLRDEESAGTYGSSS